MADFVEARLQIALQDPLRRFALAQRREALFNGVRRGSFLPEPVRVRVACGLRDGIEGQQVERLHRAIFHRGDIDSTLPHLPRRLRDLSPSPTRITHCAASVCGSSVFAAALTPI